VPARISCTGSISVPPIRWSGRISAAARAEASVSSSVSETTSIHVSCPLERMSSINALSSSVGSPTSLQPTWRSPLSATEAYTSRASVSVTSSRVSMKMNSIIQGS
jgi:hypothetical protein